VKRHGQTLTRYVEEILEREAAPPPREEVYERISSREPADISTEEIVWMIRADRGSLPPT
jgi:hypothetical protein